MPGVEEALEVPAPAELHYDSDLVVAAGVYDLRMTTYQRQVYVRQEHSEHEPLSAVKWKLPQNNTCST